MKRIITFGTYDLFHLGHLKILKRAAELGDELIVGVSTDALNYSKKQKYPVFCESDRIEIIEGLKVVNEVFREESLELKGEYIKKYNADVLVMGDDWEGKFDNFSDLCEVVYLARTPEISTTEIKDYISNGMPSSSNINRPSIKNSAT
jgi:glycerol-3-phosphate cytidylyltransferase